MPKRPRPSKAIEVEKFSGRPIDYAKKYFGAAVAAVGGAGVIIGGLAAVYAHRDWLGFEDSYVTIRPISSTKDYMRFLAENNGNRPASVGRVSGEFRFAGKKGSAFSGNLRLDLEEADTIIPADGSQTLRVHFVDQARLDTLESYLSGVGDLTGTECTFGFEVINYDGHRERLQAAFDCRSFLGPYLGIGNGNLPLRYPVGSPPP